eukprot:GFUD01114297.1.p1 GENE.GFUD01114297.1~~GFUD01114297.1.p1  ORF type:complete len:114 (-),score=29.92 GFUD01114297.1:20-361(-)
MNKYNRIENRCLKQSNLNYLVNETPYSAFVTIRKKFVKEASEISDVTAALNDIFLKHENIDLKGKCEIGGEITTALHLKEARINLARLEKVCKEKDDNLLLQEYSLKNREITE